MVPYDEVTTEGQEAETEDLRGERIRTALIKRLETTTEIRIDTFDDNIAEYNEQFVVRLTGARSLDARQQGDLATDQAELFCDH